jgi:hypothetical protein
MSRMLVVFLLLVAGVVALGIHQGWFTFTSKNSDDKTNINIEVDKEKIKDDEKKAAKKVQEAAEEIKDKTKPPGKPPQ